MARNDNKLSNWVGWVFFAGFMMVISGLFSVVDGLTGLLKHNWYVVSSTSHLLVFNYQAWGWIDLVLGLVILLAGFSVLHGSKLARVVGVVFAALSALGALASVSEIPIWSVIIVAIDVLIIFALTVHGDELSENK